MKTPLSLRALTVLSFVSLAAVGCAQLAEIAGGSGSASSSASATPAPDQWTGRVRPAGRRVRLSVPEMDAVRFEVDTAGAAPVVAYLIAPSGHRMTQHDPALIYSADCCQQVFWIRNPEQGTWKVVLRSTSGSQQVTVKAIPIPIAQNPIARAQVHVTGGRTIHVTSVGSHDPDGTIVSYEWSFGDGTYDPHPTADHTYAAPGTYVVSLIVKDNEGLDGFDFTKLELR